VCDQWANLHLNYVVVHSGGNKQTKPQLLIHNKINSRLYELNEAKSHGTTAG
jgi:hypothetical protein